ncbi:MAG: hypothetical protein OXH79_19720 [Boseongicola sp.]|nr:hypothetical protein [Boseongicola sp.]
MTRLTFMLPYSHARDLPRTDISSGEAAIVPYASISPFARGDGVETRLMVGGGRVNGAPFPMGTTTFPAGSSGPMHSRSGGGQVAILEGGALADSAGVQSEP